MSSSIWYTDWLFAEEPVIPSPPLSDTTTTVRESEDPTTTVEKLNGIIINLQEENKQLKKEARVTSENARQLEEKRKSSETEANKFAENSRREFLDKLNKLEIENHSLKKRMANTKQGKLQVDNRMSENINERCRPSVIAIQYQTLESQEWMDAKESLEDSSEMDEEEITRFLCSAIMRPCREYPQKREREEATEMMQMGATNAHENTYEKSCYIYSCLEDAISILIRRPTLAVNIVQNQASSELSCLPDGMPDAIRTQLRQTCDHIESEEIVKLVQISLPQEKDTEAVNSYLHACARLTWQMTIQNPPMKISADDKEYNEERHKLWWSCDQTHASKLRHFIWPVLYDYEDGNLMVKGCVYVG